MNLVALAFAVFGLTLNSFTSSATAAEAPRCFTSEKANVGTIQIGDPRQLGEPTEVAFILADAKNKFDRNLVLVYQLNLSLPHHQAFLSLASAAKHNKKAVSIKIESECQKKIQEVFPNGAVLSGNKLISLTEWGNDQVDVRE